MHTPSGHINHFWKLVSNAIKLYMKNCPWQERLRVIDELVAQKIDAIMGKIKLCKLTPATKAADKRLQVIRKKKKNTVVGPAYDFLSSQEDGIIEELRELASATT